MVSDVSTESSEVDRSATERGLMRIGVSGILNVSCEEQTLNDARFA